MTTKITPDEVEIVAWWLDPANAEARKQLREHNPELEAWLQMVEQKVNERLAQAEAQAKAEGEKVTQG